MTQIVSSISGIEIYAPSAGNAPTNSSEVSAIASGYQVVSATATQLYAGTSFLTSVNSTPVSASRAGNAANASLATSAWYDGTGRLISALPDKAAVSSIASGYVTGVSATVANNSASWGGGGGSVVSPSGTIFVSGSNIEGTNSAAVLQQTAAGFTQYLEKTYFLNEIAPYLQEITYNHVDDTGANLLMEFQETAHDFPITILISGRDSAYLEQSASSFISVGENSASIPLGSIVQGISASASEHLHFPNGFSDFTAEKAGESGIVGVGELAWNSALTGVSATVANNSASWGGGVPASTVSSIASSYASSAVSGVEGTVSANSATWNNTGVAESTVSSIASSYAESAASSKLDSTAQVVTATAGDGTYITSINGLGISGQGGGGGVTVQTASARTMNSAAAYSGVTGFSGIDGVGPVVLRSGTVVAGSMRMQLGSYGTNIPYPSSVDGDQNYKWSTGNILLLSSNQGYGYFKGHQLWLCRGSAATSHRISFDVNNTTGDVMVYQSGHSAVITPTGFSIWGPTTATEHRRNIDSGTFDYWNEVSAKLDSNASSSFYTTANESGYVGSSYVDSAVSGKMDSSAMTSYALSADVSGTVDLVSTQSANWGGSALALSAGPGVKLELSGSTLVVGADETVLWSGSSAASVNTVFTLGESYTNFERIRLSLARSTTQLPSVQEFYVDGASTTLNCMVPIVDSGAGGNMYIDGVDFELTDHSTFTVLGITRKKLASTTLSTESDKPLTLFKIVGVNRTAGV